MPIPTGTDRKTLKRDGLAPPYTRPFDLKAAILKGIYLLP
jgi:hypothetical protein